MISQTPSIPPLTINNILNSPSKLPTYHQGNFIIPPLIKNNNTNANNDRPTVSISDNKTKEETTSNDSQNSHFTPVIQIGRLEMPPLMRFESSKNPIISPQINSTEEQYSSPQPLPIPAKSHSSAPIKAKWTKEEDDILKEAISKHGTNNWSLISNEIPGRTGKQCRERWLNQLNPNLNKEHWLPHEDSVLTHYQAFYGNSWSKIAHFLPGRSPNSVKNRWSFLMRHNVLQRARIWF